MKSILFISHDASRTGAPIIFLNFLKWFKANSDIPFQILLKNGGELESEFAKIAPVSIFNQVYIKQNIIIRILNRLGLNVARKNHLKNLTKKLKQANVGLIYSNTVTNGETIDFLSMLECPVISHVHELEWIIRYYAGLDNFAKVKNHTQQYITVSEIVKNNLIQNHDVLEEKIHTIYGFIPQKSHKDSTYLQTRESICQELDIPENAKIICASGTTGWRKGTDLFIQLADAVSQKYSDYPVYFLWIGGENKGGSFGELWHDVENLNLEKQVKFLGIKSNPLDYFHACDVFAMPSREDPFPLVCLEAASMGKPIVCFDKAGGIKEFVEDDCGFVVPYLDIDEMASKIVRLLQSPELCQSLGQHAQQKVKDRHDIEATAPKILQVIENSLLS
ncbi:MAG: glycosyltransferase family 4 protein [Pleurocapsa sp.]